MASCPGGGLFSAETMTRERRQLRECLLHRPQLLEDGNMFEFEEEHLVLPQKQNLLAIPTTAEPEKDASA